VPFKVNTAHQTCYYICPEPVDEPIRGPRYVIIANMGNDVMASFFFPSLNILKRNVGGHIYMTAVAALTTDSISIFIIIRH
jgi:hypothetical protein